MVVKSIVARQLAAPIKRDRIDMVLYHGDHSWPLMLRILDDHLVHQAPIGASPDQKLLDLFFPFANISLT
jgi:hypothetical protein